ncbi:phosphoenolpyruvate synthase [Candidatus Saccharibacteria bacterium]|nr:MAG: phosphoenolpyruvate synthase [Candidatus Saccharibacteria bacterium]
MSPLIINGNASGNVNIGTKATNLFALQKKGYAVPHFICVSPDLLAACLSKYDTEVTAALRAITGNNETNIIGASKQLSASIAKIEIDDQARRAIEQALDDQFAHGTVFSVRSSASVEDSAAASFAGQFETFLRVPREKVIKRIVDCWQSLYAPSVLKYCCNTSVPPTELSMCVIIQEMIEADVSGVMFSANPQGLLNETVITVGKGTGDHIVGDKVATTSYYYNVTDAAYYHERQPGAPLLGETHVTELIALCGQLVEHFGTYIDIEFAIKSERVYVLQVRKITTIDDTEPTILDNSNIVESYPGITLPLTVSFIQQAYYHVFRGLLQRGTGSKKLITQYEPLLQHMVTSVNGRVYYRISNWYTLMQFLPLSGRIIPIWQEMMGVSHRQHIIADVYRKRWNPLRDLAIVLRSILLTMTLPRKMRVLHADFLRAESHFWDHYRSDLTPKQKMTLYHSVTNSILKNWDLTLSNDVYAFVFTSLLKRKLERLGASTTTKKSLSGIADIESMQPVRELATLAEYVVEHNILDDLMCLADDKAVRALLEEHHSEFADKFWSYTQTYGDRSLEELKLESKTFRSSPHLLMQQIITYASDPLALAEIIAALERQPAETDFQKRIDKYSWPNQVLLRFYRQHMIVGVRNRETSRLDRSRIYGMVRTVVLSIADTLQQAGQLGSASDVFYLYFDELEQCVRDSKVNFLATIQQRKNDYAAYSGLPAYSRLVFAQDVFDKQPQHVTAHYDQLSSNLSGIGSSAGRAEAEVVVVYSPKDAVNTTGKIVVTRTTDPGWVFLLTTVKGVIAEKGSLLSHTAIISRELGVPSVVGVRGATQKLKTGDRVRIDGTKGTVEVI